MSDQELIGLLNKEIENDIKQTERPISIGLTSYDKENLKKQNKYKLKKVTLTGLITAGVILAMGAIAVNKFSSKESKLASVKELESNLDQNEMPVLEQLTEYSITVEEYTSILSKKDHKKEEEIEKRMDLIHQIRNLTNTADFLMKEKIKESLGITDGYIKVSIYRESNSSHPMDCIIVKNQENEIYRTTNVPKEVREILNYQEQINTYNGSGENEVWASEINNFMKIGNKLYNSIFEFSEKEFYFDGEKLKCQNSNKSI